LVPPTFFLILSLSKDALKQCSMIVDTARGNRAAGTPPETNETLCLLRDIARKYLSPI